MLNFGKVKSVIAGWWQTAVGTATPSILCPHEHKFIDQSWKRIAKRKYILQNRYICAKCNNSELRGIKE